MNFKISNFIKCNFTKLNFSELKFRKLICNDRILKKLNLENRILKNSEDWYFKNCILKIEFEEIEFQKFECYGENKFKKKKKFQWTEFKEWILNDWIPKKIKS